MDSCFSTLGDGGHTIHLHSDTLALEEVLYPEKVPGNVTCWYILRCTFASSSDTRTAEIKNSRVENVCQQVNRCAAVSEAVLMIMNLDEINYFFG